MMKKVWPWLLRTHRPVTVIAIVLFCMVACIITLGFIPFSNTMMKTTIERIAGESLPGTLSFDKMTITLWNGLTLKKVQYVYSEQGVKIDCKLDRITVSYYLFPILFKHIIVKNILLVRPEIRCDFPASARRVTPPVLPFSFKALERALGSIPYTIVVRNISVNEANMAILREGRLSLSCNQAALSMKVGLKRTLSVAGRLNVAEVEIPKTGRVGNVKASLRVNGSEIAIDNFRASAYGGVVTVKGKADLSKNFLEGLEMTIDNMKIGEWYRLSGAGPGELNGKLDASMKLASSALVADSLTGNGWVKLSDVSSRGIPLQKNLLVLLFIPKLATMKFSSIYSELSLKKSKLYNVKCTGKGDPLDFNANGWVGLSGGIFQDAEGVFSGDFVRGLPPIVKNSLLPVPGDNEKRLFKCTISGTFQKPSCRVDERIQQQAVHNVFDAIGRFFRKR